MSAGPDDDPGAFGSYSVRGISSNRLLLSGFLIRQFDGEEEKKEGSSGAGPLPIVG